MIRSKALRVHDQVFDDRKAGGPEWLDGDGVTVGVLAHVELAGGGAALGAVRLAIDHDPAGAADAFPAVAVEGDRLMARVDQTFVEHVEHLEERHVLAHVGHGVLHHGTGVGRPGLAPDPEGEIEGLHL